VTLELIDAALVALAVTWLVTAAALGTHWFARKRTPSPRPNQADRFTP